MKYGSVCKANDVEPERAIRLYQASPDGWILQVRDHLLLHNRAKGKDFIVASASLAKEDLVAMRDAINALLSEHGGS
jgi:hypothetical protein